MIIEIDVPNGWTLDRVDHVRRIGQMHYYEVRLMNEQGRVVTGEAENPCLAAAAARNNIQKRKA